MEKKEKAWEKNTITEAAELDEILKMEETGVVDGLVHHEVKH